jgi:hypothetical protein
MLLVAASQADETAWRSSKVLPSFSAQFQTSTDFALASENELIHIAKSKILVIDFMLVSPRGRIASLEHRA